MEKIRITAHLTAPIVTGGGYMTLDGLLGAVLFDLLEDVEAAHAAIPVKNTAGLFHASGAVIEPIDKGRIVFIAALRQGHAIDPDLILKNKRGELHRKFDTTFTNVMNGYRLLTAPTITWYAEGDADRIRQLLDPVQFIGKRRASGFGRVARWDFAPDDLDGIEGPFGEPLRPVPAEMFRGDKSLPIVDAAWRPAYWCVEHRASRAGCVSPPARGRHLCPWHRPMGALFDQATPSNPRPRDPYRVHYRVVDEYGGETLSGPLDSHLNPAADAGRTRGFLSGRVGPDHLLDSIFEADGYPADEVHDFITDASSSFYPEFRSAISDRIDRWLGAVASGAAGED